MSLHPFSISLSPALWVAGGAGVQLSSGAGWQVHLIDWLHGLCPGKLSKSQKYEQRTEHFHVWVLRCTACVITVCAYAVSSHLLVSWWVSQHTWATLDESALAAAVICSLGRCLKVCHCVWCNCTVLCCSFCFVPCESTPANVHTHFTHAHFTLCPSMPSVNTSQWSVVVKAHS